MKHVTITIKGTKPYLFHAFKVSVLSSKKSLTGKAGDNPDEWRTTIYNDGKRLYVPGLNMLSAIIAGGKYVKVGRGTLSTKVGSAITLLEDKIYFNYELPKDLDDITNESLIDAGQPVYLDIQGVRNPATKGRNARYRLALKAGWELQFSLDFDDTIISREQLDETMQALGKLVGFSDGRTLGFGRFEVTQFDVKKK